MALQESLREASQEQLDADVAELKGAQLHLEMREEESSTLHDQRTKLTTELARLRI